MARETQITITVETDEARRELEKLRKKLGQTEDKAGKTKRNLAQLTKGFAVLGTAIAAAGAAGLTFLKTQVAIADRIGKTADKIGLSVEALQELRFAADLAGVPVTALDMGLQRFARRSAEAAKGQGVLTKEFEALNIQTKDAEGNLRSLDDVLLDYADAIAAASDPQEQLRLAFKAFDSEGAALVNLFRQGSIGVKELRQELRDLGGVMSTDTVRQAEQMQDQFTRLSAVIQGKLNFALGITLDLMEDLGAIDRAFDFDFSTLEDATAAADSQAESIKALMNREAELQDMLRRGAQLGINYAEVQQQLDATTKQRIISEQRFNAILEERSRLEKQAVSDSTAIITTQLEFIDLEEIQARRLTDLAAGYEMVFGSAVKYVQGQRALNALLEAGAITAAQYDAELQKLSDSTLGVAKSTEKTQAILADNEDILKGLTETIDLTDQLKDAAKDAAGEMSDAFVDFALTGEESFGDMVESMLTDLAKLVVQTQILKGLSAAFPSVFGAADGAVISGGEATGFAKGGVVNSPTVFPMADGIGLMGEAGPEAIMPLSRGKDGKLGVAGGGTTVNVYNESGAEVDIKTSGDGRTIDMFITQAVAKGFQNGSFDKHLNSNFGLSRRGK
jgi:lambda family phage tail tape measure protein